MQLLVIQRILGLLLVIFSSTLLPPLAVELYYQDGSVLPICRSFLHYRW